MHEDGHREEVNCVKKCLTVESTTGRIELAAKLYYRSKEKRKKRENYRKTTAEETSRQTTNVFI